eukprot:jgi/Chlat1/7312/Chrsp58S06882
MSLAVWAPASVPVSLPLSSAGRGGRRRMNSLTKQKQITRCSAQRQRGLPPGLLVRVARAAWTTVWKIMMSQLAPSDKSGAYQRPTSQFRNRVDAIDRSEAGRYHLYAALSCPWAHRTMIVHALKGLEEAVPLSIASPGPTGLWVFDPAGAPPEVEPGVLSPSADQAEGQATVRDVYLVADSSWSGRATVPMLYDTVEKRVVNNESAEIIEILNSSFNTCASNPTLDLAPSSSLSEMEAWNDRIYNTVNNGVYRCGFATSQASQDIGAYDGAVAALFETLDAIEKQLTQRSYLCGDQPTLADVRLFTTLFRFDAVYYVLFKCCKRRIADYPNLYKYMQRFYQLPGVSKTCSLEAVRKSYFGSLFPLNPGGIVPVTPAVALLADTRTKVAV